MILLINGKPAAIRADANIEYNSVNPLFGDREDYTLAIELPLNDKNNLAIFGRMDRLDADIKDLYYDADIIDGDFRKSGAVAVTSVSESLIKVQFLADRSFQNYYPEFDDKYIDELELPSMPKWIPDNIAEKTNGYTDNRNKNQNNRGGATNRGTSDENGATEYKSPAEAWGTDDIIALPWVNASSGNIQNLADYGPRAGGNAYFWHVAAVDEDDTEAVEQLSTQIRLYTLTSYICQAIGYSFNASAWAASDYYHLYSFNCLPAAWDACSWARTLPHWSLNEFFEQLEKLMLCNIVIDHKKKSVSFSWQQSGIGASKVIDEVLVEHTATVTKDDESQYRPARNIGYADAGHNMSNIYSCPWYFEKERRTMEFDTMQEIANWLAAQPRSWYMGYAKDILFYAKDEDMHFILYVTKRELVDKNKVWWYQRYGNFYRLLPLNAYGTRIIDEDEKDSAETINIIPAWIDDTDRGPIPFFDAGTTGDDYTAERYNPIDPKTGFKPTDKDLVDGDQIIQPYKYDFIKEGEKDKSNSYSKLQVAFWYGMDKRTWGNQGELPRPFLTKKEFVAVWSYYNPDDRNITFDQWQVVLNPGNGSLRLNTSLYGMGAKFDEWINIDTKKKYEISFLMDGMPDVKDVFIIHGKRYLCAEIKADITANGMSRLKKGTFYRITTSPSS